MKNSALNVGKSPIAFFIFRRPEMTKTVLREILRSKPTTLYIFADGPRNIGDVSMVEKTRATVDTLLCNEPINVIKNYNNVNLGLKRSIIEGLNKVFLHEDTVIILEDDCLPSAHFFDFCNNALVIFKRDKRVSTICGTNIDSSKGKGNYCLTSKYFIPWGWAIWKRTWKDYMKIENEEISTVSTKNGTKRFLMWYLLEAYKLSEKGIINAWSYKMTLMQLIRDTFSLIPPSNLVSNIGFGVYSSNTFFKTLASNLEIGKESFAAKNSISQYHYNENYDNNVVEKIFLTPVSLIGLIARKYFPFLIKLVYRK